jgi:hypothetical protein
MRVLTVLLLLLTGTAQAGQNNRTGQNEWCWVTGKTNVEFCDYSSFSSCREKNKGGDGTCIKR